MSSAFRHRLVLVVLTLAVLFLNLGGPRLWDRDEPRNAGCAAEMWQRGDWVTPVFNGELRTHKPVLLYWLMMSAYAVFGVGEFAARFWSATLGAGTVALTYFIAGRLFNTRTAFWSAVSLTTMMMFVVASRAATPDAPLVFFCTAAMAVYVAAAFPPWGASRGVGEFPARWTHAAAMYGLMAFGVLAKGPVGLVAPTAVIGMYLLLRRLPAAPFPADAAFLTRLRFLGGRFLQTFAPRHFLATCGYMRPGTAVAMLMLVAAPWYFWVGMRTDGAWLEGFFLEHNIGRALRPMEGHGGSLWFYPAALLAGAFPWSLLLPATLRLLFSGRQGPPVGPGLLLAGCWVGVYILLFSLAQTKLPSYITPCYPGLALLVGWFCSRCELGAIQLPHLWARVAFTCLALFGIALLIALPIVAHILLPGLEWLGLLGVIPLIGGITCLRFAQQSRPAPMLTSLGVTAGLLAVAIFGVAAQAVDHYRGLQPILQAVNAAGDDASIAVFECLEPSWIYYTRRQVHMTRIHPSEQQPEAAEAIAGVTALRAGSSGLSKPVLYDVNRYLASSPDALLITRSDRLPLLQQHVDTPWEIVAEGPLFLRQGRRLIVLRGRPATPPPSGAGQHRTARIRPPVSPRLY